MMVDEVVHVKEKSLADPNQQSNSPITQGEERDGDVLLATSQQVFECVLDWSPFIAVQLFGNAGANSVLVTFLIGTILALFVKLYHDSCWFQQEGRSTSTTAAVGALGTGAWWSWNTKKQSRGETSGATAGEDVFFTPRPKLMDVGQLTLFGLLFVLALIAEYAAGKTYHTPYLKQLIFLWFNPLTIGGIAFIMYTTVSKGKPFVYRYVQMYMYPSVFDRFVSKRWFRQKIIEASMIWVKSFTVMAVILSIRPLLVTILYNADPNTDGGVVGFVNVCGYWLFALGQLGIVTHAVYSSYQMSRSDEFIKRRVQHIIQHGLSQEEKHLYGDKVFLNNLETKNHCIETITDEAQLDLAADVLTYAFQNEDMIKGFLHSEEQKLNFFRAHLKTFAPFNHVFACFNKYVKANAKGPLKAQSVMVCIPVLSASREELEVFHTYQAWVQYGFTDPTTPTTTRKTTTTTTTLGLAKTEMDMKNDFPLPHDDLVEMGRLKKKEENRIWNKPFLYIVFHGTDYLYRERGYGRTLMKHVIGLSIQKQLPLVVEVSTSMNRIYYEKYGFRVIDRLKSRPKWLLMMRPTVGGQIGYRFLRPIRKTGYGAV